MPARKKSLTLTQPRTLTRHHPVYKPEKIHPFQSKVQGKNRFHRKENKKVNTLFKKYAREKISRVIYRFFPTSNSCSHSHALAHGGCLPLPHSIVLLAVLELVVGRLLKSGKNHPPLQRTTGPGGAER